MTKATDIRCDGDLKLYQALLSHADVKRMRNRIEREEQKREGPATRRQLLATSVRLSRTMAGSLHKMADQCIERLDIDTSLELYAYASPQSNAACFKPEDGRVFIMFSSHLLECFDPTELLFVMGHELGHHVYQHHDIPIGYLLRGKRPPASDLALDLFAWSRYAEISADRAGAYCAEDLHSVAHALFKLASGITRQDVVKFDLEAFLKQVDDMLAFDEAPGHSAPMQDWFSTHPFSPLRVNALKYFDESSLMRPQGFDKAQLENRVQQLMRLMEPGYMEGKTPSTRAMRDLFIAAAVVIAAAERGVSAKEHKVLQEFVGKHLVLERLDIEQLQSLLPQRIAEVKKNTQIAQRMQVVRDLCLVASAEQPVAKRELELVEKVAEDLGVSLDFVRQSLDLPAELD